MLTTKLYSNLDIEHCIGWQLYKRDLLHCSTDHVRAGGKSEASPPPRAQGENSTRGASKILWCSDVNALLSELQRRIQASEEVEQE